MDIGKIEYPAAIVKQGHLVLDETQFAPYYLNAIAQKFSRRISQIAREQFGIGLVEWRLLVVLAWDIPITAHNVSDKALVDRALVTKGFRSLQEKGLIDLAPQPTNTRSRLATLTEKGHEIFDQLLPIVLEREAVLLNGVDPNERDQFLETLGKIVKNLDDL
ncbi:MAG: MarR family winged helix-turn-helix transcriptional regulator [Chloroflexota bacterium]